MHEEKQSKFFAQSGDEHAMKGMFMVKWNVDNNLWCSFYAIDAELLMFISQC